MGARWYDPALARWASADTIVPDPGNPQSLNRYSFVLGNPLRFVDPTGHEEQGACSDPNEECIDDEIYEAYWAYCAEHAADPACQSGDPLELAFWFTVGIGGGIVLEDLILMGGGLLGEGVKRFIGWLGGLLCGDGSCTNEAEAAGQGIQKGLGAFSQAARYGVKTYDELRQVIQGTGLQAHHLIEQRFAERLGVDPGSIPSIALTPAEHQMLTTAWRNAIGYSNSGQAVNTLTVSEQDIWNAARMIYASSPEILTAIRRFLGK